MWNLNEGHPGLDATSSHNPPVGRAEEGGKIGTGATAVRGRPRPLHYT